MNMQRDITGSKIAYRPLIEAELSVGERDRACRAQERAARTARIMRSNLGRASRDLADSKPLAAKWFCLKLETGREFAVEKILLEANVDAFMPREKVIRIRRGTKLESEQPYLPGYILVRLVPSDTAFHGLKRVKHVVDIVGGPSGYHIVNSAHVDVFKRICAKGEVPRIATDKTFKDGDKADITYGPFAGFLCLVVRVTWSRQARARVAIDLAGKVFEIDSMPLAFLKKL